MVQGRRGATVSRIDSCVGISLEFTRHGLSNPGIAAGVEPSALIEFFSSLNLHIQLLLPPTLYDDYRLHFHAGASYSHREFVCR